MTEPASLGRVRFDAELLAVRNFKSVTNCAPDFILRGLWESIEKK
jgi:hypothetical protein